ncbi:hypothetical protein GCM10027275_34830 [Rhabdobacter roseus]|uniref:Zn ribbon nucleic-acid-binding protein n=1 Tax=Rhabdobacter roseus TaxID=1655419 RepID=A0A840TM36_9BACT|nr:hypothetical protein [Rhabdobacter roseus]MBB5285296.1 Zn ribbon nucleic-acid-binding protein [Rhabdobacter roseus]
MFLIRGRRTKFKKAWQLNAPCPNCEQKNTLALSVFTSYAHLFWIPFFSMGRTGAVLCSHCGYTEEVKKTNEEIYGLYNTLKSEVKIPLTYYMGFPLLFIVFFHSIISSNDVRAEKSEYLEHPEVGDVYVFKPTGQAEFMGFRVVDVQEDTLFVHMNMYGSTSGYKMETADVDTSYIDFRIGYPKAELKEWHQQNGIYSIKRKNKE